MKFLPSDATLLQAILFGCGSSSVTLNSILNTLVSLGFDMPNFVEFDGGVARLQQAGLITFQGLRVTPTPKALRLADEIACPDGSIEHFHERLRQVFESWSKDAPTSNGPESTGVLTAKDYDKAFA